MTPRLFLLSPRGASALATRLRTPEGAPRGDVFQLRFPLACVGRGDMSRGGLLLRQVAEGVELEYGLARGAVRRGPRPPKLPRLTRHAIRPGDPPP